jgi:hypothetical protein
VIVEEFANGFYFATLEYVFAKLPARALGREKKIVPALLGPYPIDDQFIPRAVFVD